MAVRLKLDSLTDDQKKTIRKYLCLQPKKTNFATRKFYSTTKDPILFYWIDKPTNEIVLPYFFANSLLKTHFNSKLIYPPGRFRFTGTLRDYQIPIVNKALIQLHSLGTTSLIVATGLGKSIMATYLSSVMMGFAGGLTLVLVNRETIQTGWEKTYTEHTDAVTWIINKGKLKVPEKCNVILCMNGRFEKIPYEIRKMVSVLIVDEAHLFCTATQVSVLLGTCPKNIIICTATLERDNGMHSMIHAMAGTHKVKVKHTKFFTIMKYCTGIRTEICKTKHGDPDWAKLVHDLAFDPDRNNLILDIVEKYKTHKIMILTWSASHVDHLTDLLLKRKESVDKLVGNKSTYIDSRVLVGTISKISTGFDCKNVAINFDGSDIDLLISAGSTKSVVLHDQSIGRPRSETPIIIDLVDDNRISKKHWGCRKKNYINEYNCEIIEVIIKTKKTKGENKAKELVNSQIAAANKSMLNRLKNKK